MDKTILHQTQHPTPKQTTILPSKFCKFYNSVNSDSDKRHTTPQNGKPNQNNGTLYQNSKTRNRKNGNPNQKNGYPNQNNGEHYHNNGNLA